MFLKNIQRGDTLKNFFFLNNTEFYYGISKDTIRMPFRGLAMLKSTKLITKGGLCYGYAMVGFAMEDQWLLYFQSNYLIQ